MIERRKVGYTVDSKWNQVIGGMAVDALEIRVRPDPFAESGGHGFGIGAARRANQFPIRLQDRGKSLEVLGRAIQQADQILEIKIDRKDARRISAFDGSSKPGWR